MHRSNHKKSSASRAVKALYVSSSLLAIAACENAWAASEGHGHGTLADITWFWINFSIYIVIMYFLLRNPIVKGWAARRARITEALDQSQRELRTAEQAVLDAKRQLKSVDAEISAIRSQITRQAEMESEGIINSAKERSARIVSQAKELVTSEQRSAERAIREELSRKVLERAEAMLADSSNSSSDQEFRKAALQIAQKVIH